MARNEDRSQKDHTTDMAGPEVQKSDLIDYEARLPHEGQPVHYGGKQFEEAHPHGLTKEEAEKARKIAERQLDPELAGQGRKLDWSEGVPSRNLQGMDYHALDGVSESGIVGDPTLSDPDRNRKSERPISWKDLEKEQP